MINFSKYYWFLITLCLLPWFFTQAQLSINGDAAWLITATERLLTGEKMSEAFYEVNPPLSIFYHLPPVLIGKLLPIPLHYILFLYFTGLIALSAWTFNAIMKHWPFIKANHRYVILAAYLAANTVFTTIAIGERDHIVLLGLMPFLAAQLSMAWGYELPKKLLWPVLVAGTIAVLIKPHFGLLPTIVIAHRLFAGKKLLPVLRSFDFLSLAVGSLTYLAIVWLCFRDFITIILPDVLDLYITNKDYQAALPELLIHTYLFAVFLGIEAFFTSLKERQKTLLILLYAGALLCLVPYAVQMKGFYYQLIPAMGFFFCGFALSLYSHVSHYAGNWKHLFPTLIIAIFALAYVNRPLLLTYPSHGDYKDLPLSKEIANCEKPCPYFIFNDSIEIMHPTAFYQGLQNASRFPTFWFLPKLAQEQYKLDQGRDTSLERGEIWSYRNKYGQMVADDLRKYHPKMLIIGQYRLTPEERNFDFAEFFAVNDDFRNEWDRYVKQKTITVNQKHYFKGTALEKDYPLTYDIYLYN